MSGWSYLGDKRWAQITREERFFCERLFRLLDESPKSLREFILLLQKKGLDLDPDVEWEGAFEVCFFRDLGLHNENAKIFSQKRTFDLCLFSESTVVIIEAKAQQGFDLDYLQLEGLEQDKKDVSELLPARIFLVGLAAQRHIGALAEAMSRSFDALISWKELAENLFHNDPILERADSLYDPNRSFSSNNEERMKGRDLFNLENATRYVGRLGGRDGIRKDIRNGDWLERYYQTSSNPVANRNWVTLQEFVDLVNEGRGGEPPKEINVVKK